VVVVREVVVLVAQDERAPRAEALEHAHGVAHALGRERPVGVAVQLEGLKAEGANISARAPSPGAKPSTRLYSAATPTPPGPMPTRGAVAQREREAHAVVLALQRVGRFADGLEGARGVGLEPPQRRPPSRR
jgi:hypothetical protein